MRIVLAGGGTTGHISPLLATAEALSDLAPDVELTCVGTPAGLETTLVPQAGRTLRLIDPVPLPRRLSADLLAVPVRLGRATAQAGRILTETRAEVVVGFGGYAALPVCLAARRARLPLVIHEANAVPGLANRIAARFAVRTCVTFDGTGLPRPVRTGMPVRRAVATLDRAAGREEARRRLGLDEAATVLLVSGGSQGARSLNAALIDALPGLDALGVSVLHVTGQRNFAEPVALPQLHWTTYRRVAYVDRMEEAYAAADLMLARAGSGTVNETAIVGLPAIFVPLPHGNGEQAKNAAGLIAAGAGVLVPDAELTAERLVAAVGKLMAPGQLAAMSAAARAAVPRDAAMAVARYVLEAGGQPCH